jgi:toxin ParE1/3/4
MTIVWSPLAMDRASEIAAYIAIDSPAAAEAWIRKLFVRVGQLERFPQSGRRLPETRRKEIREIVWGNYRIIYRHDDDGQSAKRHDSSGRLRSGLIRS